MFPARRPVAAGHRTPIATKPDPYAGARPKESRSRNGRPRPHHRRHDQHRHDRIPADSVDDIIGEVAAARVTERGTRADDKASEAAMEDRKKQGYF
jgi:hypothetical protein